MPCLFYRSATLDGAPKGTWLGSDSDRMQTSNWFPEATLITPRVCALLFTVSLPPALPYRTLTMAGAPVRRPGPRGVHWSGGGPALQHSSGFHTFLNPATFCALETICSQSKERQTNKHQNNVTGTMVGPNGTRRGGQFSTKYTPLVTRGSSQYL